MKIPFNKPYISGNEIKYITEAIRYGHISGNGNFTKRCHEFFRDRWGFGKCLLTTSCTDALEMCALLLDIKAGDEVIMPSYTFVSTALAFVRQGAKIVFIDSKVDHPGLDEDQIEKHITSRTKAIVPVHYAGVACDMDRIMDLAAKYDLIVIEEAAQAIDSYYKGKPLGSIGHLATFSFHETKNIQCGEGGLLVVNDRRFEDRAEILWEKGTNRAQFFRGEINKYNWVDIGSSFLPSDLLGAFLLAQLENVDQIENRRREIWDWYDQNIEHFLSDFRFRKPLIPEYATNNAHMYYVVCSSLNERTRLISYLKSKGIHAVFHYLSLHESPYYLEVINVDPSFRQSLPNCELYSDCLLRLPLFYELDITNLTSFLRR